MNVITILTSIVTFLLAIIGYFIKSHIENVEQDVKKLRNEVSALKQDSIWITKAVGDIKDMNLVGSKDNRAILSKISARLDLLKDNEAHIEGRLNAQEKHLENYGKVIHALVNKKS